jgi:hypothetical protein
MMCVDSRRKCPIRLYRNNNAQAIQERSRSSVDTNACRLSIKNICCRFSVDNVDFYVRLLLNIDKCHRLIDQLHQMTRQQCLVIVRNRTQYSHDSCNENSLIFLLFVFDIIDTSQLYVRVSTYVILTCCVR